MKMFNLPDLRGALADFLTRIDNRDSFHIGSRRIGNIDSLLPFDNLQVWTKVQVQNRSYFPPHCVLPPQTINASPPSDLWTYSQSDVVLINTDNAKVWPHSGLEGCVLYFIFISFILTSQFNSGHHVVQLQLIFCAIPSRITPSAPGTGLFLTYARRFDIIPQLNSAVQASSTQKGLYPDPSTGMYVLKCSRRSNGTIMGDVLPLGQLRTLLDIVPRFGADANKQLTKETSLEFSLEFWLNKYFEKELFYALK